MNDEDEFLDFYDFSKTYENHPLLMKALKEKEEAKIEDVKETQSEDEWDDCELDEEDVASGDEDSSFVDVEKPATESTTSFEVVGESEEIDSSKPKKKAFEEKKGTGTTREEAFLELKIKKAKYLPSGEVLLGNGKIMGHRQFHYIYK